FDNISFLGNSTDRRGGALFLYHYADLTIQGGVFLNNVTTNASNLGGGAIYAVGADAANSTKLLINGTKFEKNISSYFGGAIYANGSTENTWKNLFFYENESI